MEMTISSTQMRKAPTDLKVIQRQGTTTTALARAPVSAAQTQIESGLSASRFEDTLLENRENQMDSDSTRNFEAVPSNVFSAASAGGGGGGGGCLLN
jgi:hypothetical protein